MSKKAKRGKDLQPRAFDVSAAFEHLQAGLAHSLGAADVVFHPTAKGDNAELNWIKMLRQFLPQRYSVDRAFVVDVNNSISDQIDVVIFDRHYSPLLFRHEGSLYVPAESVYAAIEVKPCLCKQHVLYAAEKVASVRRLHRTSAQITHAGGNFDPIEPKPIIGGLLTTWSNWKEPLGVKLRGVLDDVDVAGRIDIGVALRDGAFEYSRDDAGVGQLRTHRSDRALLSFAMSLFSLLQFVGTVPAIDLHRWLEAAT